MGEHYRFFDSIDGKDERVYSADEFAEYFRQLLTSGVLNGDTNLEVQSNGADMTVSIQLGYAWLEGYLYKVDGEPLPLQVDAADPILSRIDRVVIRLDKRLDHRYVKAFLLKGEPAEEPLPPTLTRDENIFEISLAQIHIVAGKSFIDVTGITDERFDEAVCGLVNSLIKVDTQHLIDRFEATWGEWFHGIRQDTFVPLKNLKDGFIRTPDDLFYSVPSSKLYKRTGWPVGYNDIGFELDRLSLDTAGNISVTQLKDEVLPLLRHDVSATLASQNLHIDSQLAIPFAVSTDVKFLTIKMLLKRYSIGRIRAIICEADEIGMPNLQKELGRHFSDNYNELTTDFGELSWDISLSEILLSTKQYFLVIYGYSSSYYINAAYANTPDEKNYYHTTTRGTKWNVMERTPFVEITGKQLADSGTITMDYGQVPDLLKHVLLEVQLTDATASFFTIDFLSSQGDVLLADYQPGSWLFEEALEREAKIRITLHRVGEEEPQLLNFEHTWIQDTIGQEKDQAIIPSHRRIAHYPGVAGVSVSNISDYGRTAIRITAGKAGSYRLKCELRASSSSVSAYLHVFLTGSSTVVGRRIGYASMTGDEFRPLTLDLEAIPANSKLVLNLGTNLSTEQSITIRNVELCGEPGYQEDTITRA